jgi:hypothetical protein
VPASSRSTALAALSVAAPARLRRYCSGDSVTTMVDLQAQFLISRISLLASW